MAGKASNITLQLNAIIREANRYKTVRSTWLVANLRRVLDDPANWTIPDEVPSFTGPIGVPPPVTLLAFLGSRGGLTPDGDLTAMDAHKKFVPGYGMLVRREGGGGMSLDYAREVAEEAGYLPDHSDIPTLLEAISEELHGRPCYRIADLGLLASEEAPF